MIDDYTGNADHTAPEDYPPPAKPNYLLQGRNGYHAIDRYMGDECRDLVIAGLAKRDGEILVGALNQAVEHGREYESCLLGATERETGTLIIAHGENSAHHIAGLLLMEFINFEVLPVPGEEGTWQFRANVADIPTARQAIGL